MAEFKPKPKTDFFPHEKQAANGGPFEGGHKLFLGGLTRDTTDEMLFKHFSKYGEVDDCVVMFKRCFGFVTFRHKSAMLAAVKDTHILDNRKIDVKTAVPREKISSNKLFIGGLTQEVSTRELARYFSKYGRVVDCVVMRDKKNDRSRGFGFVQFDHPEPAEAVMADYHNHCLDGKWVEVKHAEPPEFSTANGGPPLPGGPNEFHNNNQMMRRGPGGGPGGHLNQMNNGRQKNRSRWSDFQSRFRQKMGFDPSGGDWNSYAGNQNGMPWNGEGNMGWGQDMNGSWGDNSWNDGTWDSWENWNNPQNWAADGSWNGPMSSWPDAGSNQNQQSYSGSNFSPGQNGFNPEMMMQMQGMMMGNPNMMNSMMSPMQHGMMMNNGMMMNQNMMQSPNNPNNGRMDKKSAPSHASGSTPPKVYHP